MYILGDINNIIYQDLQKVYAAKKIKASDPVNTALSQQKEITQKKDDYAALRNSLLTLASAAEIMKKTSVFYSNEAFSSENKIVSAVAGAFSTISTYQVSNITLAKQAQKSSIEDLKIANTGSYSDRTSTAVINDLAGDVDQNKKLNDSENNIQGYTTIQNGSFTINNKTIAVNTAQDTLATILSKINSSGAGVTAKLENNKVIIQSTEKGNKEITLGNDTSELLTALKVNTSQSFTAGTDSDLTKALTDITAQDSPLKSVTAGFFNINGITFEINPDTDSLQSIINKINNSQAGVTAFYDEQNDALSVTSKEAGKNIEFTNNDSNFITKALGNTETATFTAGQVTINGQTMAINSNTLTMNGVTFNFKDNSISGATITIGRDTQTAKEEIKGFIAKFNNFTAELENKTKTGNSLSGDFMAKAIEQKLRQLPLKEIDNPGQYRSLQDIGITYENGELSVNEEKLGQALSNDPESVASLFSYDSDSDNIRDDGGIANNMISSIIEPALSSTDSNLLTSINILEKRESDLTYRIENIRRRSQSKVQSLNEQFARFSASMDKTKEMKQKIASDILLKLFEA